jgi:hypothetical protein
MGKNDRKVLGEKKKVKTNLKSKNDMDYLRKVHELDMAEERKDINLKCCKMLESCKDRGEDDNICYDCYVIWNDIIKTLSLVHSYVISLECPELNASIEDILQNISFRHLTNYCIIRTEIKKAKVNKMLCFIQGRLFLLVMRVFFIDLL